MYRSLMILICLGCFYLSLAVSQSLIEKAEKPQQPVLEKPSKNQEKISPTQSDQEAFNTEEEQEEGDSFADDQQQQQQQQVKDQVPVTPACHPDQYNCQNTSVCLNYTWRCDDIEDCPYQDDEKYCEESSCPEDTHWRCPSTGRCILASWKCDGDIDCDGGEDEKNCVRNTCDQEWFQCASGTCISPNFICDGDKDCPDGDDETREICVSRCSDGFFLCSKSTPMKCLPGPWACDGDRDCLEGEDEANCTNDSEASKGPGNKGTGSSGGGGKGNHKRFKYGLINNRGKL